LVLVDGFLIMRYKVLVLFANWSYIVCHSRQASWIVADGNQDGRNLFGSQIRRFCATVI